MKLVRAKNVIRLQQRGEVIKRIAGTQPQRCQVKSNLGRSADARHLKVMPTGEETMPQETRKARIRNRKHPGEVVVVKVDTELHSRTARNLGVQGLPAVFRTLSDHAEQLIESRVLPGLVTPIRRAIASGGV